MTKRPAKKPQLRKREKKAIRSTATAEQIAAAAERGYSDGLVDGEKVGFVRGLASALEAIVALQPGGAPKIAAVDPPSQQ